MAKQLLKESVYNWHDIKHVCNTWTLQACSRRTGVHTVKENAEALVVATKEIGLEVSADKTKYMVMSRDRNAGQDDRVKVDNSSIERVEEFKYLGTTLTDQNPI
jgi:hypothetical protein